MVPRWPYYRMGGGGGRADFELAMWSPDRAPVVRELSVGLEYSEKCKKIRNPTVGTYCFGRLPDSSPHSGRGRPVSSHHSFSSPTARAKLVGGSSKAHSHEVKPLPPPRHLIRRSRPRGAGDAQRSPTATVGGGVGEATKTIGSRGQIPDFFTLFRVLEPYRQFPHHWGSIRRPHR